MKKFVFVLAAMIISVTFISVNKAEAGAPVIRIVAGSQAEKALFAIAEKAGFKYASKSARDRARQKWNMHIQDLIDKHGDTATTRSYEEFIESMNRSNVIPFKDNPNIGSWLISAAAFATGVDIIMDTWNEMSAAEKAETAVDFMKKSDAEFKGSISNWGGVRAVREPNYKHNGKEIGRVSFGIPYEIGYVWGLDIAATGWYNFRIAAVTVFGTTGYMVTSHMEFLNTDGNPETSVSENFYPNKLLFPIMIETAVPTPEELPTGTPGTWVQPLRETKTLPESIPEKDLDLVVPVGDNPWPANEPLNDPLPKKSPLPGTEPGTDPGAEPAPDPGAEPGPIPGIEPAPQPEPLPEPAPKDPPADGGDGEGPQTNPNDTANRWGKLITNKFPFSLPWDIYDVLAALAAEPKRPEFNIDKDLPVTVMGKTYTYKLKIQNDNKWMDGFVGLFRTMILIGFIIFLITSTRKLLGGAQ